MNECRKILAFQITLIIRKYLGNTYKRDKSAFKN